jgi:hypothetical protein
MLNSRSFGLKNKTVKIVLVLLVALAMFVTIFIAKPGTLNKVMDHQDVTTAQQIEDMKQFDLAIVEPYTLSDAQLTKLHAADVLVIAYVPTTSIDQQWTPFTGIGESDYLFLNGKRIANNNDDPPDWIMDPRSAHYRRIITDYTRSIYARGFDGVFLDTLAEATDFSGNKEVLDATVELVNEIRNIDTDKLICQNGGWWKDPPLSLIDYTAPLIDFMMWEHYPYEKGTVDPWINAKRDYVIGLSNRHSFKVLTARFIKWHDYRGVRRYYDAARAYGFIPYAPWTSGAPIYNTVNTYYLPPRTYTKTLPSSLSAPPEYRSTHDINSFVIHWGITHHH